MNRPVESFDDGAALLALERTFRHCHSRQELLFAAVNEPHVLINNDQTVLWVADMSGSPVIAAVSGLAQLSGSTPYTQWLVRVFKYLLRHPSESTVQVVAAADLPQDLASEGADWLSQHALHAVLHAPDSTVIAGLWIVRQEAFDDRDAALVEWLADAIGFSLWSWEHRRSTVLRWMERKFVALKGLAAIVVVAAIGIIPVRLSALAPAEITPTNPMPVTAPAEGVVQKIIPKPNQPVVQGDVLIEFDDTTTRNRLEVARKSREIAVADLQRATTKAFSDDASKADLQMLDARVRERDAEIAYLSEVLQRMRILAPRGGIAIFSDPNDWIGKPVQTGERIMMLANPLEMELTIYLSPDDAVQLSVGSEVRMYLNAAPLSSYRARVTQTSYELALTPQGQTAYVLKAAFEAERSDLRIGLKGTAKVYAKSVPLFYYLLRRPIAYVRRVLAL